MNPQGVSNLKYLAVFPTEKSVEFPNLTSHNLETAAGNLKFY